MDTSMHSVHPVLISQDRTRNKINHRDKVYEQYLWLNFWIHLSCTNNTNYTRVMSFPSVYCSAAVVAVIIADVFRQYIRA